MYDFLKKSNIKISDNPYYLSVTQVNCYETIMIEPIAWGLSIDIKLLCIYIYANALTERQIESCFLSL